MPRSDYDIIFLTPEKVDEYTARSIRSLVTEYFGNLPWFNKEAIVQALNEGVVIVLARNALGAFIGMGTVTKVRLLTHWRCEINHVFVSDKQGSGIKTALVRELVRWAEHSGVSYVSLVGSPRNVSLSELYRRMGFVLHDEAGYWECRFE